MYECVNNHNADWLIIGKMYNGVEDVNKASWLYIVKDDGSKSKCARYRFKPLAEKRNEIIDEILKLVI
jgi:hypothetical protein